MEPDLGDITFTSAPASSSAFLGCRSSDSSTPSVAIAATLIPARFFSAIGFLLRREMRFREAAFARIPQRCCLCPHQRILSVMLSNLLHDLGENSAVRSAGPLHLKNCGERWRGVIYGDCLVMDSWPYARSIKNQRHMRVIAVRQSVCGAGG